MLRDISSGSLPSEFRYYRGQFCLSGFSVSKIKYLSSTSDDVLDQLHPLKPLAKIWNHFVIGKYKVNSNIEKSNSNQQPQDYFSPQSWFWTSTTMLVLKVMLQQPQNNKKKKEKTTKYLNYIKIIRNASKTPRCGIFCKLCSFIMKMFKSHPFVINCSSNTTLSAGIARCRDEKIIQCNLENG